MVKKIVTVVLLSLVVMQLLQPAKNKSEGLDENDISFTYEMPEEVHAILIKKCYDCHSNNTHYPWYAHVQPVGWWLASHISEGKKHLDFSSFKTYPEKKANHKLEELSEAVTDGWMPLETYVWLHRDAKVTPKETRLINDWIASLGVPIKIN
ncbi:MAG: heme-binding domain-containing protein [Cyclobacteriaceae bacterium]|nr:heme-binding domain-containing protein [Cyclobacteriaceae bacterium]